MLVSLSSSSGISGAVSRASVARNGVVVDAEVVRQRLHEAVREDRIDLHYQPVVDLSNGTTVGVEALARWHDCELGPVPPDHFIPVAESSGLIV